MATVFIILQVLASVMLIALILLQTTKSEQSGSTSGMGWGTIGGKSTSSIRTRWGFEEHLNRITMWVAIGFIATSLFAAIIRMRQG